MSYTDKVDEQLTQRETQVHEALAIARRVEETLETAGWKEIIEPTIEKMLIDILGGKTRSGKWSKGKVDKARKEDTWRYYVGYKQFGIDLLDRIYAYVDAIKRGEDELKVIDDLKKRGFKRPMEDTRY